MTPLGTLSRLPVFALVVAATGCSDNLTQVAAPRQSVAAEAVPNASNTGAKAPTLLLEARFGDDAIYAGTSFSPPPGRELYRLNLTGSGFPLEAPIVVRIIGVDVNGVRSNPGSSGGSPTGIVNTTYGATCPSRFVEMYAVVSSAAGVTESNHVKMSC